MTASASAFPSAASPASPRSTAPGGTPSVDAAMPTLDAATLRGWLDEAARGAGEVALLDVREHGQYGEGHPFFAVSVPYSRLELDAPRLVPRRATRIVLVDDEDGRAVAVRAAARLRALGYTDVHRLAGGAAAWAAAGHALFQGVNLPSKTFGERVEEALGTPHISAPDLQARLRSGAPLVLLDGRTPEEHRKMTIPGALPVPNGELALRWRALVPDATTPIVVHCAGRTRSIVGAQILRDLGVPNPVLALENGTQGWALAGFDLERGSARAIPSAPADADAVAAARADAARAAAREGVPVLDAATAQAWLDDAGRTTFVVDVRTAAEFAAGSLPGAVHVPGGQLLQAADLAVGVRGSRVLLLDDDAIRAPVAALWLRRLGFEAATVAGGIAAPLRPPAPAAVSLPAPPPERDAAALAAGPGPDRALWVDLQPSQAYRARHAAGARWSVRPRLPEDVRAWTGGDRHRPVLLLAADPDIARLAAQDLRDAGWTDLAWARPATAEAAGVAQAASPDAPSQAESIDYLFFVHDRHDGNLDAARRYLAWETGLIAQARPDELAAFRLPARPPA